MDSGFRHNYTIILNQYKQVSILGLMDSGFRQVTNNQHTTNTQRFNPWFNGFRF